MPGPSKWKWIRTVGPSEVRALAGKLNAPVGYSLKGKQWLEHDNPNAVGMTGLLGYGGCWDAINHADVLLMLNPPCPRRTCLTRTTSRASGSTITSPAAMSPARIMASTDEDTTVREGRFHPDPECGMSGTWTAGNAPADHPRLCRGRSGRLRLPY